MNEKYFDEKRKEMVEYQIKLRGVEDPLVLKAMLKVKRHLFVPEDLRKEAYEDYPLPIGEDQTISQPYMVAIMTELLELKGDEKVLEIGTGSGYQTAILAEIAKEVYSVERIKSLAERAKNILDKLGYSNIKIKVGDGSEGWEEFSPYDAILVTAGAPDVPEPLFEQLKEGGRLVIPVGGRFSQTLVRVRKIKGKKKVEEFFDCAFVPLIGKYGFGG